MIVIISSPGREAAGREAKGTGRSAIAAAATRRALLAATVQGGEDDDGVGMVSIFILEYNRATK